MAEETRRRRKRRKKKKSIGKYIFAGCASILLLLVVAGIGVAWFVYRDVRDTTDVIYEEPEEESRMIHEGRAGGPPNVDAGEDPFSVLIMGIDTGEFGRTEQGRSDVMMLMTVNPNTDRMSIVSIPRDTYTEIVGRGHQDKINHAYAFGGTSMAMNTVQNLFDVPVDYYVSVNMEGMQQVVDAVGGVDVTPPLTFTQDGYTFQQDQTTRMDGSMALAYSRMRQGDPEGDYGRQGRQRDIIEGTLRRLASVDSVMNYREVLAAMGDNVRTNMSFDDMVDMFNNYRSAADSINQEQMSGSGQMIDGIYYEIIPSEEVNRVSNYLKTELEMN